MPENPSTIAAALRQALTATPALRAYGVVDAAQCVELAYEAKLLHGKEIRSLFLPEVQTPLWDVAPYLVPIDPGSGYLDSWARRWGSNAGILLLTAADESALHDHLRKIFVVDDEDGQAYFFRFYDPRVLRTFVPTCSPEQLRDLFGPINELLAEADEATLLKLSIDGAGKLNQASTPVSCRAGIPA